MQLIELHTCTCTRASFIYIFPVVAIYRISTCTRRALEPAVRYYMISMSCGDFLAHVVVHVKWYMPT